MMTFNSSLLSRSTRTVLCLSLIMLTFASFAADGSKHPDFSGYWTVRFEKQPSNQDMIDELPGDAVMIDDAGAGELGLNDFAGLRLSKTAQEEVRHYNYEDELKVENTCVAPSVVFYMQAPFPMAIHQDVKYIFFQIEYFDLYRIIFMDGRGHPPADAPHSKSGHSIGHWEGDTLVVDTTHIESGTFMNNGLTHSDNIHMVERFRMSQDGNTLWATQVYDDPDVFSGLAARYMAWRRDPKGYIYPYDCDPSYGR